MWRRAWTGVGLEFEFPRRARFRFVVELRRTAVALTEGVRVRMSAKLRPLTELKASEVYAVWERAAGGSVRWSRVPALRSRMNRACSENGDCASTSAGFPAFQPEAIDISLHGVDLPLNSCAAASACPSASRRIRSDP